MQTVRTNLDNTAPSQYTNFDFSSMCVYNGEIICAGTGGIAILGGCNDDGVNIDAEWEYPRTDLGTTDEKRMAYLYYSGEVESELTVEVSFDNRTPLPPVSIYKLDSDQPLQTAPTKLAEGAKGVHVGFNFKNVDGSDFSVNAIELLPTIIKRASKRF